MTDIRTHYDPEAIHCDWEEGVGDLVSGDDLQTSIIISLFTDRLANINDEHEGDRKGWWGDLNSDYRIGSRFWLLRREKLTSQVALRAEEYAKEALFWLVEDGVVKSIHIDARIRAPDRLYLTISYTQPDQDSQEMLKFYWVWSKNAI